MDRGGGVSRIRVLREKGKGIKKRKKLGRVWALLFLLIL